MLFRVHRDERYVHAANDCLVHTPCREWYMRNLDKAANTRISIMSVSRLSCFAANYILTKIL